MRLLLAVEKASGLTGASIDQLSNAIFFDYFQQAGGVVKLRRSEETLHFYDNASSEVLELTISHNHNAGTEDVTKLRYPLPAENGFATRALGPYSEFIDHATALELGTQAAGPFLKSRRTHARIDALVSLAFAGRWPNDAKLPAGLLLADRPKLLQQPMWLSGRFEPETGACFISLIDARAGTLVAQATLYLAAGVALWGDSTMIVAGIGAYLLKLFLLALLAAGLFFAWPEMGAGVALGALWATLTGAVVTGGAGAVAAGWAFLGTCVGVIGGAIALLRDFLLERSGNATDAWKQRRDAIQARIDAAQARAQAGQQARDPAETRAGLEDERQALKDMRDLLDDPDSGIDKAAAEGMQQAYDQAVAGIDSVLSR